MIDITWQQRYHENASPSVSVYQSACGQYGKVVRTTKTGGNCPVYGKSKIKYFRWGDDEKEFKSLDEVVK